MKVQPVVKRDTLRLAVGMVAPVVLTVLGFWGAGRLDYTVVLGALLGYLVTVGNFFLLALKNFFLIIFFCRSQIGLR